MAFQQMYPQNAGFQQIHPENAGFQQMHDSNNPAAQAYARVALARNGIHVGPNEDAAAMWRQFSAQRASQRAQAVQAGPDAPDMGISPNQPLGGPTVDQPGVGDMPLGHEHYPATGPNLLDWHTRIAQMANHLSSANLDQRAQMTPTQFQAMQQGPAESALQIMRMQAVGRAHGAAKQLAKYMAARRPSQMVRRTHDPVRF